jgi:hypothetical protein
MLDVLLPRVLILLGVGFLAANVRLGVDIVRYLRLRSTAVLTWPGRRPPFYGLTLGLGVVLGILIFVKLVLQSRPPLDVFGESMMFVYYGYLVPLSLRIGRGFYQDGVWVDGGFLPYSEIGGMRWRDGEEPTLVVIPRMKQLAHRLVVPSRYYGEVRRMLRDLIARHQIMFSGETLELAHHDEREDV